MKDFILSSLVVVSVLFAVVPLLAGITSHLVKFWTRGKKEPAYMFNIQKRLFCFVTSRFDNMDSVCQWLTFNVLINLMLLFVLTRLIIASPAYMMMWYLVGAVSVVALVFVPRWVMDISSTLRMKKGDSERLRELEQQIEQIKQGK